MQVEDRVDAVLGTDVNNAVEMLEALGFQDSWVHVILEMAVIERNADAVESKGLEEGGIFVLEKVLEEL